MAWTSPRTWSVEAPTAAQFNEQIRDNLTVLKTSIGDDGRFLGLTSAYLADLSGVNLTGDFSKPGQANTFTAGRTRLIGTARLVVPVGTDKFDGASGNKTPGSMWVEGNYLHWVDSDSPGNEWRYLGASLGAPGGGALAGSVWVEGNDIHYIDASAVERKVVYIGPTKHGDASAIPASLWVESNYIGWIVEGGSAEYEGHQDQAAQSHQDNPHYDAGHADSHTDNHSDDAHQDDHTDGHADTHADHQDYGHADVHADNHYDTHTDVAYSDSHSDSHSDSPHADSTYSDHLDTPHYDGPPELIGTV